jgi:pre-mRNA-splicing factor ISY1
MPASEDAPPTEREQMLAHARSAASYIPFLSPAYLLPPTLPTHAETESVLLALRKKALVEEYFGES